LLEAGCVSIRPDDPVTFRSGILAPVYVDNRRLISHPSAWHTVIDALAGECAAWSPAVEVVAGVEAAGIPHSSALAFAMRLPSVFVRKEAKEHGLGRRVEGGDVAGQRTLLVEDMVTTGGSSLSAVAALREAGASVDACLAIITYGFAEAERAFADATVELRVLTSFGTLVEVAQASGRLDPAGAAVVRSWLQDPHAWRP
jgi:orotate phosphoribosyltransferase